MDAETTAEDHPLAADAATAARGASATADPVLRSLANPRRTRL